MKLFWIEFCLVIAKEAELIFYKRHQDEHQCNSYKQYIVLREESFLQEYNIDTLLTGIIAFLITILCLDY